MNRRPLALGGFRIHALNLGRFTVSRREMFRAGESAPENLPAAGAPGFARGSVSIAKARPLTLPPGPDHFVLAMNALLVETDRARVLIETGVGTKLSPAASRLQGLAPGPGLDAALAGIGFSSEDVDFVINTHLHFDHCGGNTEHGPDGIVRPAFPEAVYVIPKGEWDAAFNPPSRDRESYERADFEPLAASGRLRLVEGEAAVAEGIRVFPAPGHTAHHQCVTIASEGRTLCFLGDLVPTAAHAGFSFVMSYDLDPRLTLKTKRALYDRALPEGWLFALAHDPAHVFGTIVRDGTRFEFRPLDSP
jgi:glyoxylase-like metal-dependent hydrolase (beta-lactamase superfamily II)